MDINHLFGLGTKQPRIGTTEDRPFIIYEHKQNVLKTNFRVGTYQKGFR